MKKALFFFLLYQQVIAGFSQTAESAYKTGMLLKENKNSLAAITEFKKALQLDPQSYKSMYELGWCYNDVKDYKNALDYLKKVRPFWSTIPKVFFELGYAFEKTNQKDSAIENYKKCLLFKSDYKLAYKRLGFIEYDSERYAESLTHFNKYLTLDSTGSGDYLVFYRKGFAENATKNFIAAISSLQKSLAIKKDYINTYLELGYAYTQLKQATQAIHFFKEANKIDTKSHIPYNGIGEVYRDIYKNIDSAMYWYFQTLSLKPKERKASFGIGYCMNSKKQYTDAVPYLKTAIEQEPSYTAAFVELGYSYYKLNQLSDAETNFKKGLLLSPMNHNAHYYLCLLYIDQKKKTEALKEVEELKKINSKYVTELNNKVIKL